MGLVPSTNFLKTHDIWDCVSVFRQRSFCVGGPLRLSYSQTMGTTVTVTC